MYVKKIFIVLISLFLFGCAAVSGIRLSSKLNKIVKDGKYDKTDIFLDWSTNPIQKLTSAVYELQTYTTYKDVQEKSKARGVGTLLNDKYVLTVEHITTAELSLPSPFNLLFINPTKVVDETYLLNEGKEYKLEKLFSDREMDVALFKVIDDVKFRSLVYGAGDSDILEVGDVVYIVGTPLGTGINVRKGVVGSLIVREDASPTSKVDNDLFIISGGIYPGDSGSPVFAILDGVFKRVGMVQAVYAEASQIGIAIRGNSVKNSLGKLYSIIENSTRSVS